MYPVLYKADETDFTSLGLGTMRDAIKCLVTEERNGIFELEMEYPANGLHFNDMEEGMLLKAKPNDTAEPQRFRIYKIEKSFNGRVNVYAEHISYALNEYPLDAFNETISGTPAVLWNKIASRSLLTVPFSFEARGFDGASASNIDIESPRSVRSFLGGRDGSLLDLYNGEYEFDNDKIIFHKNRGSDNGVSIRYGKNLTGFDLDISTEGMYTQVFPFVRKTYHLGDVDGDGEITSADAELALRQAIGQTTLTAAQKIRADMDKNGVIDDTDAQAIWAIVGSETPPATEETPDIYIFAADDNHRSDRIIQLRDSSDNRSGQLLSEKYGFARTKYLDLTDVFDYDYNVTEEDVLEQANNYISTATYIKEPKVTLTVSFQPLGGSSNDDARFKIETVGLCDTVRVSYPLYDFDKKLKVNRTVFDVLRERYKSIEIGDPKSNFADTIREQLYSD